VPRIFTGVDGGSTKTLVVSSDDRGFVVGVGESGPSNYHVVGLEQAVANINEGIRLSLGTFETPEVVTLGLAGMDTESDFKLFEEEGAPKVTGRKVYVRHDAEIALVGATGGEPGVIVIAGTGSVAGGRNERGEYARCGGWGHLVGDEGSAYFLGIEALRAVLWAFDGRGEETALTELVLEALGISSPDELIGKLYVEKIGVRGVAQLAPLVTRAAGQGDRVSKRIVDEAARHLALHVVTLIRKLGIGEPVKVAPVGGVFRAGEVILEPFRRHVEKHYRVQIVKPRFPPAVGALLLSFMAAGIEVNSALLDNIERSLEKYGVQA